MDTPTNLSKNRAQNIIMASGKLEQAKEYWLNRFADEPVSAAFLKDVDKASGLNRAKQNFQLTLELSEKLRNLSSTSDRLLFMVLLTGVKILLFRYTGEKDLTVITPVERQGEAGEYLNTILLLRDKLGSNMSFRQFLHTVRETVAEARTNQNYPWNLLLAELGLTPTEFFRVGCYLENLHQKEYLQNAGCELIFGFTTKTTVEGSAPITGYIEYPEDCYERATIAQIISHFTALLNAAVESPDTELAELPLLSAEERHQLLIEFNDTAQDYPTDQTFCQLFAAQVSQTPDRPALVYEESQLTYRELHTLSLQVAGQLSERGCKPESIIGIMVEPSLESIVGILGILQAGGAFLPIDPAYPVERIAYMLEDSGAQILLTQVGLHHSVPPEYSGEVLDINLQHLDPGSGELSAANPPNLAYVIYTSGSTGQPKGVMIEHSNLTNFIHWQIGYAELKPTDRVSKYASFSFDASVIEIFPTLAVGATLVMVPGEIKADLPRLAAWYQEMGITVAFLPTNMAELLCQDYPELLLRLLLIGGDKLNTAYKTSYPVINNYGPTENTVISTALPVQVEGRKRPPIGKPIANTQVYILDEAMRPVPVNVKGELYLAGRSLARGYLFRPELTAEKFLANPFTPGTKMYKSGDLGRWLSDGTIEFLGRIDHQVKIRGYRIETGEIEAELNQHPAVKSAIVILFEGDNNTQLVAYLVTAQTPALSELREYLENTLPKYMIPSAFVFMDSFPLTPNGKIDRRALPAPTEATYTDSEYNPPRNEIEQTLVNIWSEVLRLKRVGIHDNFFDLGGHSIKATQVISRIYKELGVQIQVRTFFQNPTIAQLAPMITTDKGTGYRGIAAQPPRQYYPLTHAQKRLWLLDQLSGGNITYNMPATFILQGPIDLAAFELTFQTIVDRHEILRTRFSELHGEPVQIVEWNYQFHLDYRSEMTGEIAEYIKRELMQPFDLTKPCLLRACLTRLKEAEHLLIFNMHHIISDGWSINILISEIIELYNAYAAGGFNPLEPLSIQYRDYAVWQNDIKEGGLALQEQYWLEKLAGELTLSFWPYERDFTRKGSEGGREVLLLSEELTQKLRKIGQEEADATLYMVVITALSILTQQLTNNSDILLGTSIAGRNHDQLENLIGFFVNTLVLRIDLSGNPDLITILRRVRETTLGAYDHQDYPYEKLVDQLLPVTEKKRDLFTIMINYLPLDDQPLVTLEGLTVQRFEHDVDVAKFDVSLYVQENRDQVSIQVVYNQSLFTADKIQKYVNYLLRILETFSENPTLGLAEINLFTTAEMNVFLADFSDEL